MTKSFSYTKAEHNVRPEFHRNINLAESGEDVKKFFVYAAQHLIEQALDGKVSVNYDDISLAQEQEHGFVVGERLKSNDDFMTARENSDLQSILKRFADSAIKHLKHLDKNLEKTKNKVYPTRGSSKR